MNKITTLRDGKIEIMPPDGLHPILLSVTEADQIFQSRQRAYAIEYAENRLLVAIAEKLGIDDYDPDADDYPATGDTYVCSAEEMCDPESSHYALGDLAQEFLSKSSVSIADDITWETIIDNYLTRMER